MFVDFVKTACGRNYYNVIKKTPLEIGYYSSKLTKNNIYFKREDLQNTFSFKLRGSYNKISQLYKLKGNIKIIACSAGNHAQGVAYSSSIFNISSKIIMPTITPSIKVEQVKRYGAEVILYGDNYDEAYAKTLEIATTEDRVLIHPYNDNDIIIGSGTIAKEILDELEKIDYMFVPVGGGGLISGIGMYAKIINPNIQIVGVEAEKSAAMTHSLKNNKIIELSSIDTFADGTAVKKVGDLTFDLCRKVVDDMVTLTNDEISTNIKNFYLDSRVIAEPSGILSLGGSIKYLSKNKIKNKNIVNIISGANMDFERLRFVAERANNEVLLNINIPEKIGSFKNLYNEIYPLNVTEFSYRYRDHKNANIYISISNNNNIIHKLNQKYKLTDLTHNDLAKEHSRYLVGYPTHLPDERFYRFLFPERPGELGLFLNKISDKWNISLFHYRNRGGLSGDVLVGIQISPDDIRDFKQFLKYIGYQYYREML